MKCVEQDVDRVPFDQVLPEIQPYARNAPVEMIMSMVRDTAIVIARETLFIKRLYYADLYPTVEDYIFEPSDEYDPLMLRRVIVEGRPLKVLTDFPVAGDEGAFYAPPNTVYISPAPAREVPDGMEIEAILAPSPNSCYLDRTFFNAFHDAIAAKVIHDLQLMPKTEWYNPQTAPRWYAQYQQKLSWWRHRGRRGAQSGPLFARSNLRWY